MPDKVRLVQCLCPERHCILAMAFTPEECSDDEAIIFLREAIRVAAEKKTINPWCLICQAPLEGWQYEARATRFATLEEARPVPEAMQEAQRLAAKAVEDYRRARNN